MARTNPSPTFPMYPGDAAPVTASDTAVFEPSVIYVGVAGDVVVTTMQGSQVTFKNVIAGTCVPVQVIKVWNTNTTASSLVRVY